MTHLTASGRTGGPVTAAIQSVSNGGFTNGGIENPHKKAKNLNPTSRRATFSEGESDKTQKRNCQLNAALLGGSCSINHARMTLPEKDAD